MACRSVVAKRPGNGEAQGHGWERKSEGLAGAGALSRRCMALHGLIKGGQAHLARHIVGLDVRGEDGEGVAHVEARVVAIHKHACARGWARATRVSEGVHSVGDELC